MADPKSTVAAGSSDADIFLSASEDEAVQQQVVTPELLSALVKQVEFYFSDANLPTDKKLLKQIRKDPEGYVPVKLFANFRKVRALSKDVGIITEALRNATLLQLSQDGKRVKRIVPVPEYDISDIQRRTIVVENLPGNPSPTIESVTEMFKVYGTVKLVRICSRESKGKLPSWLTSSCQNMNGQQHAYVEFVEEEGAILASAALASESDAPDGAVQVRRLLACIAEQRDRRSANGNGSSYGGCSGGGASCNSRKGSRDVSPMGSSRISSSRRNSGGGASSYGMPYGNYSSGGSSWTATSSGGAGSDAYHHGHHHHQSYHYHSFGGAYEHGGNSRRGSAGGAMSPALHLPPPPPPPPPRRSCDSAPQSDLLSSAAGAPPPPPAAPAPLSGRSGGVYRPPAKRISDGSNHQQQHPQQQGGIGSAPVAAGLCLGSASFPSPVAGSNCQHQQAYNRSLGGSFTSSCCTAGSVGSGSAVSTPGVVPSSPPLLLLAPSPSGTCASHPGVMLVAHSPPLSTRGSSVGGGRPPIHPAQQQHTTGTQTATQVALCAVQCAASAPPPPPPPPPSKSMVAAPSVPITVAISEPQPVALYNAVVPGPAPAPSPSLAEAIAQAQAERRASEAGAKAPAATTATAFQGPPAAAVPPAAATVAAAAPTMKTSGPTAPKFCLDLGSGLNSAPNSQRGFSRQSSGTLQESGSSGEVAAVGNVKAPTGSALIRGSQAQMVANVEDFINNILARPAARPTPVPTSGGGRKTAGSGIASSLAATPAATPRTITASSSSMPPIDDAAATIAGILASTLRRPMNSSNTTITTSATALAHAASGPKASSLAPTAVATIMLPDIVSDIASARTANASKPAMAVAAAEEDAKAVIVAASSVTPPATARATIHIAAIAAGDADGTDDGGNAMALLQSYGMQSYSTTSMTIVGDAKEDKAASQACGRAPNAPQAFPSTAGAAALGPFLTPRGHTPSAASCPNSAIACATAIASNSASTTPERLLDSSGIKAQGGNGKAGGSARGGANMSAGSGAQALGGRPGAKRLSRREYAQWAAATPGFRAEAASKYGAPAAAAATAGNTSPLATAGGLPGRSSGGGALSCAVPSPNGMALVSVSDGGLTGAPVVASVGPAGHGSGSAIWHVARGPDGSRGFAGRGRPLMM